jgi:hypothetical protein
MKTWFALACACFCALAAPTAEAQTPLEEIRRLYAAARYDDALQALVHTDAVSAPEAIERAEYRILCFLALSDEAAADAAIERLFVTQPAYRPDATRIAPGRRARFDAIGRRVRAANVQAEYDLAKRRLDAKEYREAMAGFERVLDVLATDEDDDSDLARLGGLAAAFRDLARASLEAVVVTADRQVPAVFEAGDPDVVPPVPLKPILPPMTSGLTPRRPGAGLFEIVIDTEGRIETAAVLRSLDPEYDELVLRDARTWRYRPAVRQGVAVRFRKVIEIYTAPLDTIQTVR